MKKLKIIYFSFVELDVPNACQTHTLGVLRGLSQNGCQVDALVPRPLYIRPQIPNVRFYYLWPWRFTLIGRIWIKILLCLAMFFLSMKNKYDAIYVRELQANPGPRLCSKWYRIPLYIEINDIIPEYLKMIGEKNNIIRLALRNQERDFIQASGIIVNSVPMGNWIKNKYPEVSSKVHLIINGTDSITLPKVSRTHVLQNLILPEAGFYIGFLGTIYNRFDFSTLLKSIQSLSQQIPEIFLIIIGNGSDSDQLKEEVYNMQLQHRVIFTGYIDSERLHNYLPSFDIAIIPLTKRSTDMYGSIPSKFATYASFNLPIITAESDLSGYPKELRDGIVMVPPEDPQALADMILWLYQHPDERQRRASILHDFVVKNLTWDAVAGKIFSIMKRNTIS